jgi:hypothetical protein
MIELDLSKCIFLIQRNINYHPIIIRIINNGQYISFLNIVALSTLTAVINPVELDVETATKI